MSWTLMAYNFFFQAVAILVLVTLNNLLQNYRLPFLKDFLVFVSGWCLFGFAVFFLQDVIMPLLAMKASLGMEITIKYMMVFLLMPVTLVTAFFLVRFLLGLVGERPARWFKWLYWSSGVALMVGTTLSLEYFLRTGNYEYLEVVHVWGFMVLNQMIILIALGYTHGRARAIRRPRERKLALGLVRILWSTDLFYYLLLISSSKILIATRFANIPWYYFSLAAWFYLVVAVPVFFLRRRLSRDFSDFQRPRFAVPDIGERAARLGLSSREVEIVARVLDGNSNRDIEAALFISESTVKNHLYSIYRKLGVKNRVELFRRFTES